MVLIICHLFNQGGAFSQRRGIVEIAVNRFLVVLLIVNVLKD